ncbi:MULTISPECIES: hypothetical protein [Acinetobacter]|nr:MULTISPECIES: hypothetical protein [Acinetobacter]MCH7306161.1 hypothetical protein [Acinetobacter higginsii]MCH7340080.1 hypothetical protein [Acinetobacter higginsii]MCI3877987.1 hypothetical protein [Acinetobacter higginsii]
MKIRILSLGLISILFIGCNKQPEVKSEKAQESFEVVDNKISEYMDILDNPDTPKQEQTRVLCKDYPNLYESKYIPALLKLAPKDYSKEKLMSDLKVSTDYYAEKLDINCQ